MAASLPIQVSVDGDSVCLVSGEFASQRRKSTKVKIETSLHLKDGKLVGPTVAHYATTDADSVSQMRTEGTRKP